MTEDKIAFEKLKTTLLAAIGRNRHGVRVTIESFVAAAELVKNDQAMVYEAGGQLYIKEPE